MPKQIWARIGRALDSRSAVTVAYNVRRTVRRRNGTPGSGCAFCARRRAGAEIGRTPRSYRESSTRTRGCPAGWSWTNLSTLNIGTSLLQNSSQPGVDSWPAAPSTGCATTAGWCEAEVTPSQLHAFAMPTNSANSHIPRTVEARSRRLRCARRDINGSMRPHQSELPRRSDSFRPRPFTCLFSA